MSIRNHIDAIGASDDHVVHCHLIVCQFHVSQKVEMDVMRCDGRNAKVFFPQVPAHSNAPQFLFAAQDHERDVRNHDGHWYHRSTQEEG